MLSKSFAVAVLSLCFFLVKPAASYSCNEADYAASDVLNRDYLVLGGGASGTYAAVRLRDYQKSVVLIERNEYLGGHTHTIIDPATGATTDIGVLIYHNLTVAIDFFNRFDIPLTIFTGFSNAKNEYADFAAGQLVTQFSAPDPTSGLTKWFQSLAQYPYLEYGWNLTYPVPEDLLLPFGDYVTKYGLEDAALTIFEYSQSQGNILDQPTIYVAKYFGLTNADSIANGFLTTAHYNNSETYSKARAWLGSDVLLGSHILKLERTDSGIKAAVSTPQGYKLVKARKLVSSIPPKLNHLSGWDLTAKEMQLFGQFNNSAYWTALVSDTGLNNNISYTNVQPASILDIPRLPQAYGLSPTGSIKNVFHIYFGGPKVLPKQEVRDAMIATVNTLQKLQGVPVKEPHFVILESHNPFQCAVTPEAIRGGFYKDLYSLQGKKSTFWTGSAWHTHDSAMLWRFTEGLLPTFLGR